MAYNTLLGSDGGMKLALGLVILLGCSAAAEARSTPPLKNPALLNIGFVCQWRQQCIDRQRGAMKRSLAYVERNDPPAWKIQVCNRNAGRNGTRVDWIGYENCISNPQVRPSRRGK